MKSALTLFVLLSTMAAGHLTAAQPPAFDESFAFVFIDPRTEAELKGPPFDRSVYARAVDRCRELGAKGVLIKLFLDREHSASGDEALATAMGKLPVLLQARLEPETGTLTE